MAHKCSTCSKIVPPRPNNKSYPFCCDRCRMVDLGHWFEGSYKLSRPIDPEGDAEALAAMTWPPPEDTQ